MQLENAISTAARSNLAAYGISAHIKPAKIPQVKKGLIEPAPTGTLMTGAVNGKTDAASESLRQAVEEMREFHGWGNFNIGFDRDDVTKSMVVKIIDRDTGETLRQIPPEEILKIRQHMRETLGLVFDHLA